MSELEKSVPYVLIAEISNEAAERLCALTREESLEPVVVTDGEAAVAMFGSRGLPRVLIVNPSLPKLDGFAVIGELRKLATSDDVPVLVTSAFLNLRTRASQLRERFGIAAVLAPQLSISRIQQTLRAALAVTEPAVVIDLNDPSEKTVREEARLAELEPLVDDLRPNPAIEAELAVIAREFGVSTAMVTLVLRDQLLLKLVHGETGELFCQRRVPRDPSFCRHIVEADRPEPLVVSNAVTHPAFADNEFVRAGVVGSYVGVPLTAPSGNVLGTLCLIDPMPWLGSAAMVDALTVRARHITASLLGQVPTRGRRRRPYSEPTAIVPR